MPKIKKVKVKKQEIKRDRFVEFVIELYKDIKRNWQKYTITVSVLIIVIIALTMYINSNKAKNIVANAEVYNIVQVYASGNYDAAMQQFETIKKMYYGTGAALVANYYIGLIYSEQRDFEKAKKYFNLFIKSNSKNKILKQNSYLTMTDIYINEGKVDSAIAYANKLIEKYPNSYLLAEAYMLLGNLYEMKMDVENAIKSYETIIARYPNTRYAENARIYKDMLRGAVDIFAQRAMEERAE